MAIKFSQFNLRTDHTSGMYLVGYDGNQNIHITVDNLFDDFINGTENTIAMFGTDGTVLADSILSQDAGATLLTVAGQLNVDATASFDTSITVAGASILNGDVTLGNHPTDDLITQTGTLWLNGRIKDTTNTLGDADQILVSDGGSELTFTDLSDIAVGSAEVVEVPVKNLQGSGLTKGDPVYISGSVGASGKLEVQLADASNAAKMPAVGLLKQDLGINEEGFAVVTGKLRNLITSPIDGQTPLANDVIYVKANGTTGAALTLTKPTGSNLIQNMGKVGRVSTSNDGTFVVSSILRTNDIPNLTPGKIWVGSTGNTIESSSITFTESTGAVQLNSYGSGTFTGTATRTLAVDASGNIIETPGVTVDGSGTAGTITKWYDTDTITDSIMSESGSDITIAGGNPDLILNNTGNSVPVWGIGATYQGTYGTGGKLTWINSGTAGYVGVRLETGNSKIELPRTTSYDFNLVIDNSTAVNIDGSTKNVIIGGTVNNYNRKLLVHGTLGVDGGSSSANLYLNGSSNTGTRNIYATVNGGTSPPMGRLQWHGYNQTVSLQGSNVSSPYGTSTITMPYGTSSSDFTINLGTTDRLTIDYSTGDTTLTGALEVAGKVTNVTDPTDAQDAATKAYVDAQNTNQITGSGAAGQVSFFNSASSITGNNNLYWDNSASSLGINTTQPSSALEVAGEIDSNGGDGYKIETKPWARFDTNLLTLGDWDGEGYATRIMDSDSNEAIRIINDGKVGIGATNPARKLTVEAASNPILIGTPTGKRMQWENPNYITAYSESPTAAGVYNKTFDFDGDYKGGGYVGVYNSIDGNWGVAMHAAHNLNPSGHKSNILHVVQVDDHSSNIRVESRDWGSDAQRFSGIEINDSRTPTGYPANRFRLGTGFSTEPTIPFYANGEGWFNGTSSNTKAALKVTESGDRFFEVSPNNSTTFLLGDLDALGDETYIKGDYSNIEIYSNGNLTAIFDASNRVGVGVAVPRAKLDVNGGVRIADDSTAASATNVGTLRYRTSGNNSYVDMVMQTGASTYEWVNIVQNNW